MSTQMLNAGTFAPGAPATVARGRAAARTMTMGGVTAKSLLLIAITLVFGAVGWDNAGRVLTTTSGLAFLLVYMLLLGLVFATAANPRIAPLVGPIYAVVQGLWIGAISRVYEQQFSGIVGQALLATCAIFVGVVVLSATGLVRLGSRGVKVVLSLTLGVVFLYLFGWLLSLFGATPAFLTRPTGWGIAISLVICIVAALNLLVDVQFIAQGVRAGAPKAFEWYAAFGLLSTLMWLYLEVLRLFALLNARQ